MATVSELLDIARRQIGVKESPPKSNNVRYNTWYYGREVSGAAYPWCMVFVQWVFDQAGVKLPVRTASCGALMRAAQSAGQWVTGDYRPGDVVIYDFPGGAATDHCGIVESVDGTYISAIEGNTSSASDADGGAVERRNRHRRYIVGAYRPAYEEDTMTQKQFDQMMDDWLARRAQEPASEWAKPYIEEAVEAGAMAEVNGTIERPQSFVTRQELATVAAALSKK